MKTLLALVCSGCLALLPFPAHGSPPSADAADLPATAFVSPALAETVRMIRAGVDESVLQTFVRSSAGTLNLGADQIVFLRDLGASPELVDAMLRHDRELALRAQPGAAATPPTAIRVRWRELTSAALPNELADWHPQPAYAELATQLAPFGQWFELEGYGWCWRPWIATLRPTWRPYCQGGRWLATDHGWYWESDFSWGAIVFHYGRWFAHPEAGWCWWPDTRWAPAWVTWRTGPDVVAWAPLPPGSDLVPSGQGLSFLGEPVPWRHDFHLSWEDYVSVPWSLFYCSDPGRMRFRGEDAADAWNVSDPLNDFFRGSDGLAVNRGVSAGTVMRASGLSLQTLIVRPVPPGAGRSIEPDRIVTVDGRLQILHPSASASLSTAPDRPAPPMPSSTWAASQPRPSFASPWPAPAVATVGESQPSEFERFAEDLLRHPTYEPAPEQPPSAYPVPARYPVKLTDPILSPRPYSAASANIYVIRMFPR